MTVAAPERIDATTDQGTGLVLPIAKALSHIIIVNEALAREWPLTVADAQVELEDAAAHMRDAVIPTDLMTEETVAAITGWRNALTDRIQQLGQNLNYETPLNEALDVEPLKNLAVDTWQMLTIIDRELTGLEPNSADPGRQP